MFKEPKNEQDKYRVGIIVALDNNIGSVTTNG